MVPFDWRVANITPIFKKGAKKDPANYRPVSLTSQVVKIFERLIKAKIMNFLEVNLLINNSQHGFRSKRSCLTNLLEFMEIVLNHVDEGRPVDVIFLDFQKAFDKVPHIRLLEKIKAHGIRGDVLRWIEKWLTGRQQRVEINGQQSGWKDVTSGVPQGSVLGPILFIIYINDLDDGIKSDLLKFADDVKLIGNNDSIDQGSHLRTDLQRLEGWADKWQMRFNVEKCKVMNIGVKNRCEGYLLDGLPLGTISEEKDLGVIVCKDLKVGRQCFKAAAKGNQVLGMIRRTFTNRSMSIMIPLYKSLVRPHLDYCVQAWRPHLLKDIKVLEKVQRRATRFVEECEGRSYEERLREAGLTTLETRRIRADLVEVFKILGGWEGTEEGRFFQRRVGSTRGHELKLYRKQVRLDAGKFSFGNRVCEEWNKLPGWIVSAKNVNEFKGRLDHHLRDYRGFK